MKLVLEYDFSDFHGNYCQRVREITIARLATPRATREQALKTIYEMLPAGVSWHMEATESGKVVLEAWGYGHGLDGYTER